MKKRYPMKKSKSKKVFRKAADITHSFNKQDQRPGLKRGGIRL